jgi:hypothetical protein
VQGILLLVNAESLTLPSIDQSLWDMVGGAVDDEGFGLFYAGIVALVGFEA